MMPKILWCALFCVLLVGIVAHKDHDHEHSHSHASGEHGQGEQSHDNVEIDDHKRGHTHDEPHTDQEHNSHDDHGEEAAYVKDETTTLNPEASTVIDIEPWLEEQIETQFRKSLPVFARFNGDPNVTIDCSASLIKFMLSLRKLQPWAIRSKYRLLCLCLGYKKRPVSIVLQL
ncbi:nose resistant to fluoxetine protein 6-like [Tropilaelaps mercedesae]|uniref:Nose resistant to fluoxetine protein 6-like n=1 Tax=Tropilaelaps mercedesae TaxID=418985 RepID=A0A1V9Y2K6_9ACAR|nr:nose resistant to fluoxetine protein 6-like [Tropilaelaps mercedesae]